MAVTQITMRELLKDPLYRKWFGKVPERHTLVRRPPWRVYLLEEFGGRWSQAEFHKYSEAYGFVRDNLKTAYDMTINCPSEAFRPPVVKVQGRRQYYTPQVLALVDSDTVNAAHQHEWCGYCRRWTLFLWYSKHHAFPKTFGPSPDRRCRICGVRLEFNISSWRNGRR